MNCSSDELLAGAALATHQNRRRARRHTLGRFDDVAHHVRLGDDGRVARETSLEFDVFVRELSMLERLPKLDDEFVGVDRLADEVVDAGLQCLDGSLERTVGCRDDEQQTRVLLGETAMKLDAVHLAHAKVGDDRVRHTLLDLAQRCLRRRDRSRTKTFEREHLSERVGLEGFVVDDEDVGFDVRQGVFPYVSEESGRKRRKATTRPVLCKDEVDPRLGVSA